MKMLWWCTYCDRAGILQHEDIAEAWAIEHGVDQEHRLEADDCEGEPRVMILDDEGRIQPMQHRAALAEAEIEPGHKA